MTIAASVLLVEDDDTVRETLAEFFAMLGMTVSTARSATEARSAAAQRLPDVVVMDLRLPDAEDLSLLEALRHDDPDSAIIVLTGHADVRIAVRVMQAGAHDLLEKPVHLEALQTTVVRAVEDVRLRREIAVLRARERDDGAGQPTDTSMLQPSFSRLIDLAARNDDAPVLILGETGTGKGFVARSIHDRSPRATRPFVEINCASLSTTFFESEMFGHERGAFTDARQSKRGLLEIAADGTVFLDEVGEMTLDVQPKLLKVIEEQRFRRLGGTSELRSPARVNCASNQPLATLVAEKRFRPDLFYRLQVLTITLPPLRERRAELAGLVQHFLPRGATLTAAALSALERYGWPGNIRELKNTLWRAAIVAESAPITPEILNLPTEVRPAGGGVLPPVSLATAEAVAIANALRYTHGNRVQAARLLGIARSTLHEKLRPPEPVRDPTFDDGSV